MSDLYLFWLLLFGPSLLCMFAGVGRSVCLPDDDDDCSPTLVALPLSLVAAIAKLLPAAVVRFGNQMTE